MITTDLRILKVIIYRVLQLPQFLLLFLLFLFFFLCQSSLSLIIIVILMCLQCKGNKTKSYVKGKSTKSQDTGFPITASMPQTLELQEFLCGRYMFWLLLTCTAPDDKNQEFIIYKDIAACNRYPYFFLRNCRNDCLSVCGSVGKSLNLTCFSSTVTARISGGIAC